MNSKTVKKVTRLPNRQDYHDYEALKLAWCREHPNASPLEYQRAMQNFALWLSSNTANT